MREIILLVVLLSIGFFVQYYKDSPGPDTPSDLKNTKGLQQLNTQG